MIIRRLKCPRCDGALTYADEPMNYGERDISCFTCGWRYHDKRKSQAEATLRRQQRPTHGTGQNRIKL